MRIGVVDYEAGNLRSVETALRHLGADFSTSGSPEDLLPSDRLIFPGVGEAASAMEVLRKRGLDELITSFIATGRPLLGICLGYQILMDHSDERDTGCLGIIPGNVRRFSTRPGLKVPHMGWNQVVHAGRHELFRGIPDGASFYFVHSYYVEPLSSDIVVAETSYDITFASAAAAENAVGVQFHPEKSGPHGLRLLRNFLGS